MILVFILAPGPHPTFKRVKLWLTVVSSWWLAGGDSSISIHESETPFTEPQSISISCVEILMNPSMCECELALLNRGSCYLIHIQRVSFKNICKEIAVMRQCGWTTITNRVVSVSICNCLFLAHVGEPWLSRLSPVQSVMMHSPKLPVFFHWPLLLLLLLLLFLPSTRQPNSPHLFALNCLWSPINSNYHLINALLSSLCTRLFHVSVLMVRFIRTRISSRISAVTSLLLGLLWVQPRKGSEIRGKGACSSVLLGNFLGRPRSEVNKTHH